MSGLTLLEENELPAAGNPDELPPHRALVGLALRLQAVRPNALVALVDALYLHAGEPSVALDPRG